jgi:hypothetical protein
VTVVVPGYVAQLGYDRGRLTDVDVSLPIKTRAFEDKLICTEISGTVGLFIWLSMNYFYFVPQALGEAEVNV